MPAIGENVRKADSKYVWNTACGPDPRALPEELRFAWKWRGHGLAEGTPVELEKISCPVFLSCGLNDTIWSSEQSKRVDVALRAGGNVCEAHFYENEGHSLSIDAAHDKNTKLLAFLRKHLG